MGPRVGVLESKPVDRQERGFRQADQDEKRWINE